MINSEFIKKKALELGATTCGIGDISLMKDEPARKNPFQILPNARTIIGFGFRIPKALYKTMEDKTQFYTYTSLGVKYIDETFTEIFLLKLGAIIENAGYDACLQRFIPGMKAKGDKSTNPEVKEVYELKYASPVADGKPAPEVMIDFGLAAKVCGLGEQGLHGKIIAPKYGTFMRYAFIITDMPLDFDEPFTQTLCDKCGECIKACPGHAISDGGTDSWQCAVYYRGAHKSNPFMTDEFLKDNPEREKIINGEKKFDRETALEVLEEIDFLPKTHFGYVPCLCGKKCELACRKHQEELKNER